MRWRVARRLARELRAPPGRIASPSSDAVSDPFAELRRATREVLHRARFVTLDESGLEAVASKWQAPIAPQWDRETHFAGSPADTAAYVLVLDSINFGSGWFPLLRKRAGRSGYFVISMGLKERFEQAGPWTAAELKAIEVPELAHWLRQDPTAPPVAELFELYVQSLRDLGSLVEADCAGRFEALVEGAGASAARLVHSLARMPLFRDVATFRGELRVPFYKRAQIAVSDLASAFGGAGLGAFSDLDDLTAFADNTVPHVLRCEGALHYDEALAGRIEAGEAIAPGSPPEVEIRAAADSRSRSAREGIARPRDPRRAAGGRCVAVAARPTGRLQSPPPSSDPNPLLLIRVPEPSEKGHHDRRSIARHAGFVRRSRCSRLVARGRRTGAPRT